MSTIKHLCGLRGFAESSAVLRHQSAELRHRPQDPAFSVWFFRIMPACFCPPWFVLKHSAPADIIVEVRPAQQAAQNILRRCRYGGPAKPLRKHAAAAVHYNKK